MLKVIWQIYMKSDDRFKNVYKQDKLKKKNKLKEVLSKQIVECKCWLNWVWKVDKNLVMGMKIGMFIEKFRNFNLMMKEKTNCR